MLANAYSVQLQDTHGTDGPADGGRSRAIRVSGSSSWRIGSHRRRPELAYARQAVDEADTWIVQPPVQPAFNTGPLREFVIVLPLIVTGPAAL